MVDMNFIRDNAAKILAASDVSYLKSVQLRGSIFEADCNTGAVSSVFTEFYVDHDEPLEALDKFKVRGPWCLGDLLDGHEYLVVFPAPPLSPKKFHRVAVLCKIVFRALNIQFPLAKFFFGLRPNVLKVAVIPLPECP